MNKKEKEIIRMLKWGIKKYKHNIIRHIRHKEKNTYLLSNKYTGIIKLKIEYQEE